MVRGIAAKPTARKWVGSIVLIIAAAVVVGIAARDANSDDSSAGSDPSLAGTSAASPVASSPATEASSAAPQTPPTERCDSDALDGPSKAPANAVTVSKEESLADVVAAHSGKTTYWLTPGVHRLGKSPWDQVMPHAGDTFIGGPGAVLDGGNQNRYAFTGHAPNVTISFLTVQNFGAEGQSNNEGVVNHDLAKGWTVDSSTIQKNAGAGVMLSSGSRITGNCLRDNGQYGFSAYHANGVRDVVLHGNEISGNNTDDWEVRKPGCGCTGGGKFWETSGARITDNYVHDNRGVGLWADSNNVGFRIEGNYISGNDSEGIMYETSYNALIVQQHLRTQRAGQGPDQPWIPSVGHLSFRVG